MPPAPGRSAGHPVFGERVLAGSKRGGAARGQHLLVLPVMLRRVHCSSLCAPGTGADTKVRRRVLGLQWMRRRTFQHLAFEMARGRRRGCRLRLETAPLGAHLPPATDGPIGLGGCCPGRQGAARMERVVMHKHGIHRRVGVGSMGIAPREGAHRLLHPVPTILNLLHHLRSHGPNALFNGLQALLHTLVDGVLNIAEALQHQRHPRFCYF
mmetsp:Transcript_36732/g.70418  ORF Transcript_36732/g.70418 Transcript_36732/m.70418 type:complete len:211 (+) Transcript_36732:979-1611(+)